MAGGQGLRVAIARRADQGGRHWAGVASGPEAALPYLRGGVGEVVTNPLPEALHDTEGYRAPRSATAGRVGLRIPTSPGG